ncbi:AAA family ATPase, partial [Streptomyces sp. SID7499]|nr:AAA family ATPase [Streptomyces sp. SID7499]
AIQLINAALYLRRPLLVTGEPGSGKSTLAHAVAQELGLGRVLQWSVVSRTELKQGLYEYDAIARLQDAQLSREHGSPAAPGGHNLGDYIKL